MSFQVVELEAIDWSEHAVSMRIAVDRQRFHTSYWYGSVSLTRLRSSMTEEQFGAILFHIAAFELNKYCSLALSRVSFGPYSCYVTEPFVRLWSMVFKNVWAQWRYENVKTAGRIAYDASTQACLHDSMANDWVGLGTVNEDVVRRLGREVGFGFIHRLPLDDPYSALFQLKV